MSAREPHRAGPRPWAARAELHFLALRQLRAGSGSAVLDRAFLRLGPSQTDPARVQPDPGHPRPAQDQLRFRRGPPHPGRCRPRATGQVRGGQARWGRDAPVFSETGEWETVQGSPCQLPAAGRRFSPTQEVVAFDGRLWWVDVTWGAICADPFSDRPEPRFVELPSGSVLSADASKQAIESSVFVTDADGKGVLSMRMPNVCRRVGVSGRCLRYVEVSLQEPFMLSSFALDGSHSGWMLEHRVALSRLLVDGPYPWLPLQGESRPRIGALDPYEASVVHLVVGKNIVVVDMHKGEITDHVPYKGDVSILPCVVSPWLATSRIPSGYQQDDLLDPHVVISVPCGAPWTHGFRLYSNDDGRTGYLLPGQEGRHKKEHIGRGSGSFRSTPEEMRCPKTDRWTCSSDLGS